MLPVCAIEFRAWGLALEDSDFSGLGLRVLRVIAVLRLIGAIRHPNRRPAPVLQTRTPKL